MLVWPTSSRLMITKQGRIIVKLKLIEKFGNACYQGNILHNDAK